MSCAKTSSTLRHAGPAVRSPSHVGEGPSRSGPSTCQSQKTSMWANQVATLHTIALYRHLLLAAYLSVSLEGLKVDPEAFLRRDCARSPSRHFHAFPAALQAILSGAHPQGVRSEGAGRRAKARHAARCGELKPRKVEKICATVSKKGT